MIEHIIWFIVGLVALIAGADFIVRGASRVAEYFNIPKLIIALTVVAFGTSAPELAVSIQAGIDGQTDLMLGNIIGSNISNILLILGLSALIIPLKVHANLIKIDVPVMIGITVLVYLFALSGQIYFWQCAVLSILLIVYLVFLARQSGKTTLKEKPSKRKKSVRQLVFNIILGVVGLILLIYGAQWLIDSAIVFAEMAGVSELVIGLTVVAVGTSLPEISTALVAAVKNERDIAVGSVIGSNILNLLAVLGVSGLFIPGSIPVQDALLRFDLLILIAVSVACIPIFFTGHKISRWEGATFFGFYVAYFTFLFLASAEHDVLELFSNTMLLFVIPIVTLTITTVAIREWQKRQRFKGFGKGKKSKKE